MFNFFQNKKQKEFEALFEAHSKKYLEDFMSNFDNLTAEVAKSLPSIIGVKGLGKKELSLIIATKEAYLINPTVFACVNKISKSVSTVPLTLHKRDNKGQYESVFSSPVLDLLENPNETQTQGEFLREITLHLLLCGNALVYKNKKSKKGSGVYELETLNPDFVDYTHDYHRITSYFGKPDTPLNGNKWDPDQIIHFRLTNPTNKFWGISPIQAAAQAIDLDSKILAWWGSTIENGCVKDIMFKVKHDPTQKQLDKFRANVAQQLQGWANGRGYMVLPYEYDAELLNMNPKEMDFVKSRETSSEEIMRVFDVPPPMIGSLENSSYNNMKECRLSYWLDAVLPYLNDICAVLSKRLLPDFNLSTKDYYIFFDAFSIESLEKLYLEKWPTVAEMVQVGVPLNMALKKLNMNMPKIKGGDIGYMSHNLVPLGFYEDPTVTTKDTGNAQTGTGKKV